MPLILLPAFAGGFLGSMIAGVIVGLVLVAAQRDAIPREHDSEREYARLVKRLRHRRLF